MPSRSKDFVMHFSESLRPRPKRPRNGLEEMKATTTLPASPAFFS